MKKLIALTLALALLAGFAACGTKPKTAADWLDLGEKYLLDLDYDQAISALDEAISIEPKEPRYRVIKVIVYVLKDDPDGAQQAQEEARDVPGTPMWSEGYEPEVFFPPIIEWLKEHGLLDFVQKLFELLKERWPEVVWGHEAERSTVAATATENETAPASANATTAAAMQTTAVSKPNSTSTTSAGEDFPELSKAIEAFNAATTLEEKFKYMIIDYDKYMAYLNELGLTSKNRAEIYETILGGKSPTQPITKLTADQVAQAFNEVSSTVPDNYPVGQLVLLDLSRATDMFFVGDNGNTRAWVKLDGNYLIVNT